MDYVLIFISKAFLNTSVYKNLEYFLIAAAVWSSKVVKSYLYQQQHIKINLVTLEESSLLHLAFQVIPDLPCQLIYKSAT